MDYGDKPAAAKWSLFTPPRWSLFASPLTLVRAAPGRSDTRPSLPNLVAESLGDWESRQTTDINRVLRQPQPKAAIGEPSIRPARAEHLV